MTESENREPTVQNLLTGIRKWWGLPDIEIETDAGIKRSDQQGGGMLNQRRLPGSGFDQTLGQWPVRVKIPFGRRQNPVLAHPPRRYRHPMRQAASGAFHHA